MICAASFCRSMSEALSGWRSWRNSLASVTAIARRFGDSSCTRGSGSGCRSRRYGPVSRVSAEVQAQLRAELRRQPDLTLAELGERLQHSLGLRLSKTRWSEVLLRLGLRRKKNRLTPPSRTAPAFRD